MSKRDRVVVDFAMSDSMATKQLREIANDSSRVVPMPHARKRMRQRHVTIPQIIRCLKHGVITEGPFRNIHGNWQFRLETVTAGETLAIAVALDRNNKGDYIAVITVMT